MNDKLKNIFYIFFPLIGGIIISIIINNSIDYQNLNKPPLSPPSILFPIVWSIIYILMGLSFYIYKKNNNNETTETIYYLQLVINYFWSIFFFVFKWYFFSIIWILLLDTIIIFLLLRFNKENKISFYLNIPYIIWCIFATYLTIGIYLLN